MELYGKRGLEFEPGSQWAYSNYGLMLLGVVIEKVTGQSYYDYVQEHIYEPAGMTASGSVPEDQAVPDRSIGYMDPSGADRVVPEHRHAALSRNLRRRRLLDGRGPRTVRRRAAEPQAAQPRLDGAADHRKGGVGPGTRYAYGFEDARDADGNGWVGHGGGAPGMNGDLRIYPKSGYVVAVLANLDPPAAQRISDYLDPRLPTDG